MFCAPRLFLGVTEGAGSCINVLRSRTRFGRYRGRRVLFSSFVLPNSFSSITRMSRLVFMFYASGLFLGDTEGVGSRFLILRSRTRIGRYRGRQVPFSSFALPDLFSTIPRASGSFSCFALPDMFSKVPKSSRVDLMFCAPEFVSGGTEAAESRFHVLHSQTHFGRYKSVRHRFQVLRSRTHFRRYRGRRGSFSCFALPDMFFAVPRASGPVFMFCAPRLIFESTEAVGARFHVLRSRTLFGLYRGRRVPLSCFALPDSFRAVPRAPGPNFMFCAPGLVFDGIVDLGSRWHILRSRTRFWLYQGHRGSFSCFAIPDSVSTVPRPSGLVFKICSPGHVFGGSEGVGLRSHVVRPPDSFSTVPRSSGHKFMFCTLRHFLGVTECARSRFLVLHSRTCFGRYRGRWVPFSCFALSNSFSTVVSTLGPVGIFCALGHVFGGTEGVGAHFHVLRSRTIIGQYRGRWTLGPVFMFCAPRHVLGGTKAVGGRFHVLRSRIRFGLYRGRQVPFSSFALPDSFSTVPWASGLIFMFCAHRLFLGGTEAVGAHFQVLRYRTCFWRYRGRRVPFSCFALHDSFSTVQRLSGHDFMFCAPGHFLGVTEGTRSRFHVLCSRNHFVRFRGRRVPISCFELPDSFSTVSRTLVPLAFFALPDTFLAIPRASGLVFMFCAPRLVF
jgi:hypothetical protein